METLRELARKGAAGALPEMLRLLEAMCSVDCGTGCEAVSYTHLILHSARESS